PNSTEEEKEADSIAKQTKEGKISTVTGLAARTLLTSQLFITASYRVVTEPRVVSRFDAPETASSSKDANKSKMTTTDVQKAQAGLGLDELERCASSQRRRAGWVWWLRRSPQATNEIMEHAVSVLVNDAEQRQRRATKGLLADKEALEKE